LAPGAYTLAETADGNYALSVDPVCKGTINITAGQAITCTLIYDDAAPAAPPPPPPPPPPPVSLTPATLVVVTQVNNDSGTASKSPADFTIWVDGLSPSTFPGSDIGQSLTLTPGNYNVTSTNDPLYTVSKSDGESNDCDGIIVANGETKTCVIVYIADPPTPPAIVTSPENISINTWTEGQ
jgi:hypothetical protein